MNINFEDYTEIQGGVCAPIGFRAAGVKAGIKKGSDKLDLAMILADKECDTASVYTKNKVAGAPVVITKKHTADGKARGIIVNSGNANTCTIDGEEKALAMCGLSAGVTGLKPEDFIVASTGVIGQTLNIEPIEKAIGELAEELSVDGSGDAAAAIMTTDTKAKEYAVSVKIGGVDVKIGGIAKGSGMIHPNMATLLVFITTDADISVEALYKALYAANDKTLNMVSVDGDTSTNDMVSVLASGYAGNARITEKNEDFEIFTSALYVLLKKFAKDVAGDGEGATKLIVCQVDRAPSEKIAREVAKNVITSNLVKTAVFGSDANWGRILCAIGYTEGDFNINSIDVKLASKTRNILVCKNGVGVAFSEDQANIILYNDEIKIIVDMKSGEETATAWGCDLTYEYVRINGEYRT